MGELTHIEEALKQAIKSPDLLATIKVKTAWKRALGEAAAENAQPIRVNKGVLTVRAKDSVWANQLAMMKDEMRRKLLDAASVDIEDIRFFSGPSDARAEGARERTKNP